MRPRLKAAYTTASSPSFRLTAVKNPAEKAKGR
jgi:hypothetical protein